MYPSKHMFVFVFVFCWIAVPTHSGNILPGPPFFEVRALYGNYYLLAVGIDIVNEKTF